MKFGLGEVSRERLDALLPQDRRVILNDTGLAFTNNCV